MPESQGTSTSTDTSANTKADTKADTDAHAVDVVLCVDVTASMRPVLDEVKDGVLSFPSRLGSAMARRGMPVRAMRVRFSPTAISARTRRAPSA